MGLVEDAAGKGVDALLGYGPIGLLALAGWMCVVVMGAVTIVIWRAFRSSEASRVKDLQDQIDAAEKERADMDKKMDILQAVIGAQKSQ